MGFEPDQPLSCVESVDEFKEQMENALKEAKVALVKYKDDMAKYYDWKRIPALDYQPRDKVYLDASNIQMNRPSQKLSHQRIGPFPIVSKVRNNAYHLQLPPLHELTTPSKVINQKLRYLVKWEGYGIKHTSWEPQENIHALDLVTEFHWKHPGAPQHIQRMEFDAITFHSTSSPAVLSHHSLEGGVDVRGHPHSPIPLMEYIYLDIPDRLCLSNSAYIPPHQWQTPLPSDNSICFNTFQVTLCSSPRVAIVIPPFSTVPVVYNLGLILAEDLSYSFRTSC